jgi:hypothetical protein
MLKRRRVVMTIACLSLGGGVVGSDQVSAGAAVLSATSPVTLPLKPVAGTPGATSREACPRRLKLEIGELRIAPEERVAVHVFVGKPDASIRTPLDAAGYAGSFSFFPVTGGRGQQTFALALDRLPPFERERLCSGDPPSVTLVLAPIAQGVSADQSQVEIEGATLE